MSSFLRSPPAALADHRHGIRLIADIGGTNARFALKFGPGRIGLIDVLACEDHATLVDAIRSYLATPRVPAGSLPHLGERKRQVGGGSPLPDSPLGLMDAGTGLGVSGLIPCGASWTALQSEGGHVGFSPADELEAAILRFAWRDFEHVSAERLPSGAGLEPVYRALAGECPLCDQVLETFCGMLGAQGGLYVGGGIVPRLGERSDRSCLRSRFEQKGRFAGYLAQIPTYVITADYPAFTGESAVLAETLSGQAKPGRSTTRPLLTS